MAISRQQFVVVGVSGGVDSAVAALILKNQKHHVEAVFMQNWHEPVAVEGGGCSAASDLSDAKAVCDSLKIKLHLVDFSREYWQKVFSYFLSEYAVGRTPNPDVLCNKEIKFRAFLDYAKSLGTDFIATGHYARRVTKDGKNLLLKGIDRTKDQSYFLHLLDQKQLASALFPLGELTKNEVREIARGAGLPNYAKKDSTGICFIGERKFKDFLGEYLLARPGEIVTTEGEKVGRHQGLMFFTYGQRQGIGIGGLQRFSESPWYVVFKDLEKNTLVVTQDREHPALMAKTLICSEIHWISGEESPLPLVCQAKIRYRQEDQECVVKRVDNHITVEFSQPQWAITPGQSVVFYRQEECLGGAVINSSVILTY